MSVTGLSPDEVHARLNQGTEIVAHGRQALQRVQDTVTGMVGSSFRGQSANTLAQKVQRVHDESVPILHAMEQALETARQNAAAFVGFDQG
jgi:uncharacterized protein YukE